MIGPYATGPTARSHFHGRSPPAEILLVGYVHAYNVGTHTPSEIDTVQIAPVPVNGVVVPGRQQYGGAAARGLAAGAQLLLQLGRQGVI